MLDDKDHVEENGDVAQKQLDRVARDATPVILETRIEHQLDEG